MTRYIVVQTSRHALFGVFSTEDGADKVAVQAAAVASCAPWVDHEDRPTHLDTSTYLSQSGDALCVFEVPAEIAAYDEDDIDATSVENGKIFEDFENFRFVGTLVKRVVLTAAYDDETFVGISDSDDNDLRLEIAGEDLAREMPAGEDGDEVDVKDEDGDVVGKLTFEADYGRWAFTEGAPVDDNDPEDDRANRMTSLKATMLQKLELLTVMGHVVYFDEQMDVFAIDLNDGVSVTFEGFGHAGPTFTVKMADGTEREVQYDVSQMRFADNLEAYEDIAADPLGWCQDAAGVERTATAA